MAISFFCFDSFRFVLFSMFIFFAVESSMVMFVTRIHHLTVSWNAFIQNSLPPKFCVVFVCVLIATVVKYCYSFQCINGTVHFQNGQNVKVNPTDEPTECVCVCVCSIQRKKMETSHVKWFWSFLSFVKFFDVVLFSDLSSTQCARDRWLWIFFLVER